MEPAQDRKSPNIHTVPIEEAKGWKRFIPHRMLVDKNASIATIMEGKPLFLKEAEVNGYDVIFKEGEDWGSLKEIQKGDIVVIKDGDREFQRLRYIEPCGAPGEVYLEFQILEFQEPISESLIPVRAIM